MGARSCEQSDDVLANGFLHVVLIEAFTLAGLARAYYVTGRVVRYVRKEMIMSSVYRLGVCRVVLLARGEAGRVSENPMTPTVSRQSRGGNSDELANKGACGWRPVSGSIGEYQWIRLRQELTGVGFEANTT